MLYERNPQGIVMKILFNDLLNDVCSLQESSLAGESCCWFGPQMPDTPSNLLARRLHLTRNMTLMLARSLREATTGAVAERRFIDRYEGECLIGPGTVPGSIVRIDLLAGNGEMHGAPMELDLATVEQLLPVLACFVATGTIQSTRDPSELDEPPARVLDLKIARSMLARADLCETSISAQDLIDGFLDLYRICGGDVLYSCGYDMAARMDALVERLAPLAVQTDR